MKLKKLKRSLLVATGVFLLLLSAVTLYLRTCVRPALVSMAENKTTSKATVLINSCVIKELTESERQYSELVRVERDTAGKIISVSADPVKTNAMRSYLSVSIAKELSELCGQTVYIPLGNVFNIDATIGKGPEIPVRIVSVSAVKTDLSNEFTTGAINQTLHRIMLNVDTTVTLYVPFALHDVHLTDKICIAETVIVGEVPDAYTYVVESGSSIAGALNDYSAQEYMK